VEILNPNSVLAVHYLARSAAWYRNVFGCETRDPDPGDWTFCRLGAIDFMLGDCPNAMPASDLGDPSYVAYLRVDDVEAFHDRAVDAGAEITKRLTEDPWGMREFALLSVDGHRFTFGQNTRR
jgi:predicted enzyme related to lactoylglutathione lyase